MFKSFYITLVLFVIMGLGVVVMPSYAQPKLPKQYQSNTLCDTVLLEFYWEQCGACRRIAPFVDQTEANLKSQGLKVKRINIYEGNNMQLAKSFNVNSVPAFFLFGGNKKSIQSLPIGSVSGTNLEKKIDAAISKYRASKKCS